jgi:integrase
MKACVAPFQGPPARGAFVILRLGASVAEKRATTMRLSADRVIPAQFLSDTGRKGAGPPADRPENSDEVLRVLQRPQRNQWLKPDYESGGQEFESLPSKAADNDDRIANRQAWDLGLATISDAEESRNVILDESVVLALIANARNVSAEFGLLVELAAVTGARVSQLARLEVQDVQADRSDPRLMMPSSRKGRG